MRAPSSIELLSRDMLESVVTRLARETEAYQPVWLKAAAAMPLSPILRHADGLRLPPLQFPSASPVRVPQ